MSHAAQTTAFVFQAGILRELMHAGVSADLVLGPPWARCRRLQTDALIVKSDNGARSFKDAGGLSLIAQFELSAPLTLDVDRRRHRR